MRLQNRLWVKHRLAMRVAPPFAARFQNEVRSLQIAVVFVRARLNRWVSSGAGVRNGRLGLWVSVPVARVPSGLASVLSIPLICNEGCQGEASSSIHAADHQKGSQQPARLAASALRRPGCCRDCSHCAAKAVCQHLRSSQHAQSLPCTLSACHHDISQPVPQAQRVRATQPSTLC